MTATADSTSVLRFRDEVLQASAYVPDWAGLDRSRLIRLDRNESTQSLSPRVAQAISAYVTEHGVQSYADSPELPVALAGYAGVPAASVLATNGSDQGIDISLRTFLTSGSRMLVARPEFSIFGHIAGLLGVRVDGVAYGPDLEFPYEQFEAAAAAHRPDMIVLINPNNPTGTPVDVSFIERMLISYPDVPVLVDEAYVEFTGQTAVELLADHPNLIVLRTFSKAFAMAGLRLGYVIAHPEVIAQLNKVRNPFDVNAVAAVAGQAQLGVLDEMRGWATELMTEVKPTVLDFFASRGVQVVPGAANFMLVRPARLDQAVDGLREAGILVRKMTAPSLAGMFRMSLGSRSEMATVLDVYDRLLTGSAA